MTSPRGLGTAAAVGCFCLSVGPAASAAVPVDPATLFPEPPPGATCHQTGDAVRCATVFDASAVAGEAFELPCGQLYETSSDVRRGIRWYVDGRLDRRMVFQDAHGSWSLSPSGSGPSISFVAHSSWENVDIDPTTSEETWPTTTHGLSIRVTGPDGRPLFQYAGLDTAEGVHHGLGDWAAFESPEVQASLCEALAP
jgi:hypothetical protein